MGVTPNIERVEGTRSSKAMVDWLGGRRLGYFADRAA